MPDNANFPLFWLLFLSLKVLEQLPDLLEMVVRESRNGQRQFQISLECPVDDPHSSIGLLGAQFKLTKREIQVVKEAWEVERGYNLFYVMNAFTRGAKDNDLNAEDSHRLEGVAGMVLAMAGKWCHIESTYNKRPTV